MLGGWATEAVKLILAGVLGGWSVSARRVGARRDFEPICWWDSGALPMIVSTSNGGGAGWWRAVQHHRRSRESLMG
jgi:hypothetical protein